MRGAVLDWMGSAWVGEYIGNLEMDLQEFMFWKWRVSALRLQGALTIDGILFNADYLIPKGYTPPIHADAILTPYERLMVEGHKGEWTYNDVAGPTSAGDMTLQSWSIQGKRAETYPNQGYNVNFAFRMLFQDDSEVQTSFGDHTVSATLTLQGTDRYWPTPREFSHEFVLYSPNAGLPTVATGALILEPYTFYPYSDKDGNPKYDAGTGAPV